MFLVIFKIRVFSPNYYNGVLRFVFHLVLVLQVFPYLVILTNSFGTNLGISLTKAVRQLSLNYN